MCVERATQRKREVGQVREGIIHSKRGASEIYHRPPISVEGSFASKAAGVGHSVPVFGVMATIPFALREREVRGVNHESLGRAENEQQGFKAR